MNPRSLDWLLVECAMFISEGGGRMQSHTGYIFGLLAEMTDRENTKVREGSLG